MACDCEFCTAVRVACHTAIAERDALRAENEQLRAALETIARMSYPYRLGLVRIGDAVDVAERALSSEQPNTLDPKGGE